MLGKGEFHSIAFDTIEESIENLLKNKTEENIINVIKHVGRYSSLLNTRDIENIAKNCMK